MRVALTLEQCWHKVPGGTAVAALGLAGALANRGDVDVIGVAARHRTPPGATWTPPVPVRHLPLPRTMLYEAWTALRWPDIDDVTGTLDIVHATTVIVPPRHRVPLVVTVHDLAFLHEPGHFTRHGVRLFLRNLDLIRRDADLVLCSSDATRADCVAAGLPADRLRVVLLGADPQPVSAEDVAVARRRYGLSRPYVAWTGTIEPRKNLEGLLGAFALVAKEHPHDLVLSGPAGWGTDLASLLDRATGGWRNRVKVLGFVPGHDLRAVMAGADAFCYPSLREGFGLPVLEAMGQGTPVVTSAGTSMEEVTGGAAELVDPGDPVSIAAGLNHVLDDAGHAAALIAAARVRAGELTWASCAERTVACYRELAR